MRVQDMRAQAAKSDVPLLFTANGETVRVWPAGRIDLFDWDAYAFFLDTRRLDNCADDKWVRRWR